jgi:hypothetical protein
MFPCEILNTLSQFTNISRDIYIVLTALFREI